MFALRRYFYCRLLCDDTLLKVRVAGAVSYLYLEL